MNVECFLDTNVLVYALSIDPSEALKQRKAEALIKASDFGLSTQVLQELWVSLTSKGASPLPPEAALETLDQFHDFPLAYIDYPLITSAIEHSLRYRIHYWDAAIVAAAAATVAAVASVAAVAAAIATIASIASTATTIAAIAAIATTIATANASTVHAHRRVQRECGV